MAAKVIFVGEAPSSRPGPPLGGAAGRRLALLAGLPEAELRRRCEFVNLLDRCPPLQANGKGRTFDSSAAQAAARSLERALPGGRFVLLGARVARAFGIWHRDRLPISDSGRFLVLPHPSGIVIWYNDKRNVRRASVTLRKFLRRHGA